MLLRHYLTTTLSFSLMLLSSSSSVKAQQFDGKPIENALPKVSGGDVTYFKVSDSKGQEKSLMSYSNLPSQGPFPDVKRAVIVVHGLKRDADKAYEAVLSALPKAAQWEKGVSEKSVAVIAPYFAVEEDRGKKFKDEDHALVWKDSRAWIGGYEAHKSTAKVSSFEVIDNMTRYLDDKTRFPNLVQIVLVGHSAGGQFMQRYAVVGKELGLTTPVTYWLASPSSYLWLDNKRPLPTSDCPSYNEYRYGFDKYTLTYERDWVKQAAQSNKHAERWNKRNITLSWATEDDGDAASECGAKSQGKDRGERFRNFVKAFPPPQNHCVDLVPDVAHDGGKMMGSDAGITRLFLDNFNGDGKVQPNFMDEKMSNNLGISSRSYIPPIANSKRMFSVVG